MFRRRRDCATIVHAAWACAAAGDATRARELIEHALRGERTTSLVTVWPVLVGTWVALGELDRALAFETEHHSSARARQGSRSHSSARAVIALLARSIERARTRAELTALGPAVDAVLQ